MVTILKHKYLFGPVPSRRLGVSLGIDLIPLKTCSLDCIYCECGKTNKLTTVRKEYYSIDKVINELKNYLDESPPLDYITFAGSGEPTLNSGINAVINFIKNYYPGYKLCLLTNGTLFADQQVRAEVAGVDLIIPSLDAATETAFQLINRPHQDLKCHAVVEGLAALRREYSGEIRLEIFIVPGINDSREELTALKKAVSKINPDRIQIGTLDRPGTEAWVEAASPEQLADIAGYLGQAELIGNIRPRNKIASFNQSYQAQIMQTLRRRPCTISDLEQILNLHPAELQKYLNHLLEKEVLETEHKKRGTFFKVKAPPPSYS